MRRADKAFFVHKMSQNKDVVRTINCESIVATYNVEIMQFETDYMKNIIKIHVPNKCHELK